MESTEPGSLYQNADGIVVEASNVDFLEEIAGQISAKHLFSANVATLKTSEETQKGLLDIMA
ncbi:MAG: flagellar basal body rod C-terminal domain-containing protein [Candidatus Brocadiaceae bacterium]